MSENLEALRRLGFMKRCECQPRRGDHDYGLGGPPCPDCYGGDVIDWSATLAALERAARVEAAARRAYEFLVQEGYECGARSELRAALAAAPAEDPVCECGHQRGVHIGLLGAKRLQCGLCRCDEFALSIPEPAERWREPQIGDHVKVSGTIQSIEGGIAQVALYRSYPVGAVQAMQCGALEYVPTRDGGEDAPAEDASGG